MPTTVTKVMKLGQVGVRTGTKPTDRRPIYGYTVTLSGEDENGGDIALAETTVGGGIPQDGDPGTNGLSVLNRSARQAGSRSRIWNLEIEYGFDASISSGGNVLPWLRDSTCSWGATAHTVYRDKDLTAGTPLPFINSAEDRFDPPPPITLYNPTATIIKARKKVDWNAASIALLVGTTNSASVGFVTTHGTITVAAGEAVIRDLKQIEQVWSNGIHYYEIEFTIEIEVNYPVSTVDVLQAGWHEKGTSGKQIKVIDPDTGESVPASSPQLLDASGVKLAKGGTPVFKTFKIAKAASWSALNA